jgi:molybdopterin-guanine dinucleotide biosynthesis protein A
VLESVRPLSDDVFVVASDRREYEPFGVAVLPDLYADAGVLGGIASAIRHAKRDRCLVVSCDHPFLNRALLRAMLEIEGDWDALIPVLPGKSRQGEQLIRQTLHAIYTDRCLPAIEHSLREQRLQTVGFLADVRVREIGLAEISKIDPELSSFFSVNTPDALEVARRMKMKSRSRSGINTT